MCDNALVVLKYTHQGVEGGYSSGKKVSGRGIAHA